MTGKNRTWSASLIELHLLDIQERRDVALWTHPELLDGLCIPHTEMKFITLVDT